MEESKNVQKSPPEYFDDLAALYTPSPELEPPLPVILPARPTQAEDIRAELDHALPLLSADQLRYIEARTRLNTDAAVGREWGTKNIHQWKHSRDPKLLQQVLDWLQAERTAAAEEILHRHLMKAANVKTGGLDSVDERLRQSAATEILDRAMGKPMQRVEQKTQSEQLIVTVDF